MSGSFASAFGPPLLVNLTTSIPDSKRSALADLSARKFIPSTRPSPSLGSTVWEPPAHWMINQNLSGAPPAPHSDSTSTPPSTIVSPICDGRAATKRKLTREENDIAEHATTRFSTRLAIDHAAVLYPNIDAPFSDVYDVINRLLPYHIYQHPQEDLERFINPDENNRLCDSLREVEEAKHALKYFKRYKELERRFRKARTREGTRSSPDDQLLFLCQAVLETERSDIALLSAEHRTAKAELERLEREKRTAQQVARPMYATTHPATAPVQSPYYRNYTYTYAQPYGATMTPSSAPMFSVVPTASAASYPPYTTGGAIPVQLPVSSLPALRALGINPVPSTSLPASGQPQPPAVLRSSSANGTMLSLEINVSLLQSAQMSGLAMVLNSLMSRSSAATAATATATAASNPAQPPPPPSTDESLTTEGVIGSTVE